MNRSDDSPSGRPNGEVISITPKTSPKNVASTHFSAKHLRSLLVEDLQTIYENIMVMRGHLAALRDYTPSLTQKNLMTRLMDLNHAMDAIISTSEHCLKDLTDTAG